MDAWGVRWRVGEGEKGRKGRRPGRAQSFPSMDRQEATMMLAMLLSRYELSVEREVQLFPFCGTTLLLLNPIAA